MSVGRRWAKARPLVLLGMLAVAALVCFGLSIIQISRAAEQGYAMRALERQAEELRIVVADLENRASQEYTWSSMHARLQAMGYVSVDRVEYIHATQGGYAFAK